MKKFLALLLALVMSLSLVACGGGKATEEKPAGDSGSSSSGSAEPTKMTLILRGGTYGDVIKACLPAFEAEHNVKCEVLDLSFDDLHSKIALNAPNPQGEYDLCMVDGSWKKLIMNQMIRGMLMRMHARTTGILVYRMPSLENMVYSGMVKATGGSTRTSRIQ